ncbi:hypothetical protein [Escherichia phage vB_EcoM_EP57]|nr:hypothetical protein [Escherichia phage vB_EcoM_EP57]
MFLMVCCWLLIDFNRYKWLSNSLLPWEVWLFV